MKGRRDGRVSGERRRGGHHRPGDLRGLWLPDHGDVKRPMAVAQTGSLPCRRLVIGKGSHFEVLCRLPVGDTADKLSALHTFQTRHIRAVHAIGERQQFLLEFQFEIGVLRQKPFHHLAVFLRLEAARAVNQDPAGL